MTRYPEPVFTGPDAPAPRWSSIIARVSAALAILTATAFAIAAVFVQHGANQ